MLEPQEDLKQQPLDVAGRKDQAVVLDHNLRTGASGERAWPAIGIKAAGYLQVRLAELQDQIDVAVLGEDVVELAAMRTG
jgi:hypothetical protein